MTYLRASKKYGKIFYSLCKRIKTDKGWRYKTIESYGTIKPIRYIPLLIQEDILNITKLIPNSSVDMVFADPPFNQNKDYGNYNDNKDYNEYLEWCEKWIAECWRVLKRHGSFYLMNNSHNTHYMAQIMDEYGIYRNTIVWLRAFASRADRYNPYHQDILFYTKSDGHYFDKDSEFLPYEKDWGCKEKYKTENGRRLNDVWHDISPIVAGCQASKEAILVGEGNKHKRHPAQMPLRLADRMIKAPTKQGWIVFDPFVGSGTTLISAMLLGRQAIGIDNNPYYCDIVVHRIKDSYKKIKAFDCMPTHIIGHTELYAKSLVNWDTIGIQIKSEISHQAYKEEDTITHPQSKSLEMVER